MNTLCIRDLAEVIGGQLRFGSLPPLGGELEPIRRIVTDSRRLREGDVFWGLAGEMHDGSRFAEEAFARDAAGAVISGRQLEPWPGKFTIEVADTRCALWQLGIAFRQQFDGQVIAVLGLGKTTTRHIIYSALSGAVAGFFPDQTPRDNDSLPTALQGLRDKIDFGLFELHQSRAGACDSQMQALRPDICVMIGHGNDSLKLSCHDTLLYEQFRETIARLPSSTTLIVDGDDQQLCRLVKQADHQAVVVGRGPHCDVIGENVTSRNGKLAFTIDGCRVTLPLRGRHCLNPALAAMVVGQMMDLSLDQVARGLSRYSPPLKRCQIVDKNGLTVIDDTCNCSRSSMTVAMNLLRDFEPEGREPQGREPQGREARGKRVVVCGDMEDCGDRANELHRRVGSAFVTHGGAESLVAHGQHAGAIRQGACEAGMPADRICSTTDLDVMKQFLVKTLVRNDVVLVKGNPSSPVAQVADWLTESEFSDFSRQQTNNTSDPARMLISEALPFASNLRELGAIPPG